MKSRFHLILKYIGEKSWDILLIHFTVHVIINTTKQLMG